MSYLVIARKWRPQTFEEVVGQPHVTRTLQNAIRLGRVAHSYLFTGARGVGKTSIARILAKALNCEKGPTPIPCNACSNCRETTQGNSVDVIEIDGASNRGIDSIRELRETVRYRPAKGRFKVYIIDEVHMLTTEAFNALLKTLEEPPPHVIFIFATTEPHKIPATILSRCQRFDFRRLVLPQLVEHLQRITAREGADFSAGVLYAIAREADGSMRDAQSLLEQLLAFSGDGLPDEEILDILGVIDRRSVLRAGEAILSGNATDCLDLVEDIYRRGIDSRRFCQHLCDHFRNLLFVALTDTRDTRLDLPGEEKEFLKKQASRSTADTFHVYFQMLLRGEEEIRRSSMPKIALEMLLLRMAQLPKLETLDTVLDRIASIESGFREWHASGGNVPPRARVENGPGLKTPVASPPASPAIPEQEKQQRGKSGRESSGTVPANFDDNLSLIPPPDAEHFLPEEPFPAGEDSSAKPKPSGGISASAAVDRWASFVQYLQSHHPMLWAKVAHCGIRAVSDSSLELEVPEIYEKSANGADFLEKMNETSEAFFGSRFEWVIVRKEPKARGAPDGAKAPRSSGKQIVNHPAVQQAIEILGAELVEVKPFKSTGPGTRSGKRTGERQ
jgi:DNA polymerase-3 subunit gamma/tau